MNGNVERTWADDLGFIKMEKKVLHIYQHGVKLAEIKQIMPAVEFCINGLAMNC